MTGKLKVKFAVNDGGLTPYNVAVGRDAWALLELVRAGDTGCTPITTPGPRWSHYVWKLRRMGVAIDTLDEKHAGPFAGTHARYVLRSNIKFAPAIDAGLL